MTTKIALSASLTAAISFLSAQNESPSIFGKFEERSAIAQEYGLDSLASLHPFFSTIHGEIERKKPVSSKSIPYFTHRMDSVLYNEDYKIIYEYDNRGNQTFTTIYDLQDLNGSTPSYLYAYKYDENDLKVEYIGSFWNSDLESFEPHRRETYAWQANGLMTETKSYLWISGEWSPRSKYVNAYDDQGNKMNSSLHTWNFNSQEYQINFKYSYYYNTSGGLIESVLFNRSAGPWSAHSRSVSTLNNENNPLSINHYVWQQAGEVWELQSAIDIAYSSTGLEVESIDSYMIDGEMIPASKIEKIYDQFDRLTQQKSSNWITISNDWESHGMQTYEYDHTDNLVENIRFNWDPLLEAYIPVGKMVRTYDSNYPSAHILAPEGYDKFYAYMHLSRSDYRFEGDQWILTDHMNTYYTPLENNSTADSDMIAVFPNPFRETICLRDFDSWTSFTLFDLQGRVVLQKQLSGESEFNTGQLHVGIYVFQIDGMNSKQTGKLVRE